ncbi:MAG TPA: CU044_2847 family protein [Anaerolineales bacterium]|nr:CU044_2847 family protein [Anaerolineales bacterium]HRF46504.1 CU044_2847 family protein [Anaerolineales bacterium]
MSKYLEFPLQGGGSLLIETSDERKPGASGFVRSADKSEAADKAAQTFDASIEGVKASADLLVSQLQTLSTPPDEMELFFNLKAVGELGTLVVGKTNSDANFNVTLKWHREKPGDGGAEK